MKKVIKPYIASPYSKGDVAINVKRQLDCANELMNLGFAPFVPLLSHFLHLANPRPYQDWINLDKAWVLVCDCVLRLPGESSGADGEVQLALDNNIKVFYSIDELKEYYGIVDELKRVLVPNDRKCGYCGMTDGIHKSNCEFFRKL
jgi:hypothetical protein